MLYGDTQPTYACSLRQNVDAGPPCLCSCTVVSVGALVLVDALNGESLDRLEMRALARGNDDSGLKTLRLRLCRADG